MKNFNNSWRNFLNESSRTENVPFEDTRIRIKLDNKQDLLYEVTEDELDLEQIVIDGKNIKERSPSKKEQKNAGLDQ